MPFSRFLDSSTSQRWFTKWTREREVAVLPTSQTHVFWHTANFNFSIHYERIWYCIVSEQQTETHPWPRITTALPCNSWCIDPGKSLLAFVTITGAEPDPKVKTKDSSWRMFGGTSATNMELILLGFHGTKWNLTDLTTKKNGGKVDLQLASIWIFWEIPELHGGLYLGKQSINDLNDRKL